MPLFVRAGSIVPMGPVMQYTDEKPDAPITLVVYTGADGSFSVYNDDGRSEQYRTGAWERMPVRYDDATGTVTIGAREGKGYAGMPQARTVRIKWIVPGTAVTDQNSFDSEVRWTGKALQVKRPKR